MNKFIDLTGQIFGLLTVIKYINKDSDGHSLWLCRCYCDNETVARGTHLKQGQIKSCGCLRKETSKKNGKENTKHGHTKRDWKSKTYRIWQGIKYRCNNPNNISYKYYGGRIPPITVCKRWSNKENGFQNFLKDMGEPPTKKHQIDRINNNRGYYKENCRWVTSKEQGRNRRDNHLVTYKDKTKCLSAWAEEYNINSKTLSIRIFKLKWGIERALTEKIRSKKIL